ncbi:hypothetical protein CYMTET_18745 [Cymbomonas tetramitiformis]|uniref:Uncharacterized protein n=1 Tax=Cymbomonas tetramitiformis TaxID=36881 RepID=A0AAE0G7E4_9CHLO|nr:hypothetical protein CYMTET_18745 [Cymbomonas tetramitiformis]
MDLGLGQQLGDDNDDGKSSSGDDNNDEEAIMNALCEKKALQEYMKKYPNRREIHELAVALRSLAPRAANALMGPGAEEKRRLPAISWVLASEWPVAQ